MVTIPFTAKYPTPIYRGQVAETDIICKNKWVNVSILDAVQHGIDKCICTGHPFSNIVVSRLDSPQLMLLDGPVLCDDNIVRRYPSYRLAADTRASSWISITTIAGLISPEVLAELKSTKKQLYEVLTSTIPSDLACLENSSNNICSTAELTRLTDAWTKWGDRVIFVGGNIGLPVPKNYSGIIRTIEVKQLNEESGKLLFSINTTLDPEYSYT